MQTRQFRQTRIALVAAAVLAASASCFAGGGEALDIELPSMRSPAVAVSVAPVAQPVAQEVALPRSAIADSFGGALTREQVRQQLKEARASGTLSNFGDAGDTERVLAARHAANTAQGEAIMAEYVADNQRTVALAEAEMRRAQIETEGQLAQTLALSEGEQLMTEGGAAADSEPAVRIDVIDMQTSAAPNQELVVVSLDGGDLAAQQARAMHVRRELGAMGLSQNQVYIEATGAEGEGETVAAAEAAEAAQSMEAAEAVEGATAVVAAD